MSLSMSARDRNLRILANACQRESAARFRRRPRKRVSCVSSLTPAKGSWLHVLADAYERESGL